MSLRDKASGWSVDRIREEIAERRATMKENDGIMNENPNNRYDHLQDDNRQLYAEIQILKEYL